MHSLFHLTTRIDESIQARKIAKYRKMNQYINPLIQKSIDWVIEHFKLTPSLFLTIHLLQPMQYVDCPQNIVKLC